MEGALENFAIRWFNLSLFQHVMYGLKLTFEREIYNSSLARGHKFATVK